MYYPFGETIGVWRAGGTDWNGDPLPATTTDYTNCVYWQTSSTENASGQDTIVTAWIVLLPPDADVLATDRIYLPGDDRSVDATRVISGDPWRIQSPLTGWTPGVQVTLKAVQG